MYVECSFHQPVLIILADFEDCILQTTDLSPNIDLELLAFTILECMEGTPRKELRDAAFVRRQRESNKIFGLSEGSRWSGFKLLVDFLDDLFNASKPAIAKLDRPVSSSKCEADSKS